MKRKQTIRKKVLVRILIPTLAIYIVTSVLLVANHWKGLVECEIIDIKNDGLRTSMRIEHFFQSNVTLLQGISHHFNRKGIDDAEAIASSIFPPTIYQNTHIYSLWVSSIPRTTHSVGKGLIYRYMSSGVEYDSYSIDLGDFLFYEGFRDIQAESIREPFLVLDEGTKRFLTTIACPIQMVNGQKGVVAMDISLGSILPLISLINTVQGSSTYVVSDNGYVLAHSSSSKIGMALSSLVSDEQHRTTLINAIAYREVLSIHRSDEGGRNHTFVFPVSMGSIPTNWGLIVSVPAQELAVRANRFLWLSIPLLLIGAFITFIISYIVAGRLILPIRPIAQNLKRMANGELSRKMLLPVTNEQDFNEVSESLNSVILGFRSKIAFAYDIEKGKLDSELELLGDNDRLGQSLLDMRSSLKQAQQEQGKQNELEKRAAWINQGSALFGRILSENSDNLEKLTDEAIKNLVKYLDVNQGGLFLVFDEGSNNPYLELVSTFAWNRQKFFKKRLSFGEGLAGTCILEKEIIEIKEVPDEYVTIASGLGEANPNYIIVAPLLSENNVLGVVELASFRVLDKQEVEFVGSIVKTIASAIHSVRVNARTKELLEKSQQQAEEMRAQEEEMRQNMEELLATQEELQKREATQQEMLDEKDKAIKQLRQEHSKEVAKLNTTIESLNSKAATEELKVADSKITPNKTEPSGQKSAQRTKPKRQPKGGKT